jgi:hypothetical protein
MKNYQLMTIKWDAIDKIDIAALANKLNVTEDDLDRDFGIVSVDDEQNIYSYRISTEGLAKSNIENKEDYQGPYSDVRIEPFGPESE